MLTAGQKISINWKQWLEKGRELIGSLFFPVRCPVCEEILEPEQRKYGIHPACESKLYPILGAVCMHCGRPIGDKNPNSMKNKYESDKEYCYDCIVKGYDKFSYVHQGKSLYLYKGAMKSTMYRFKYSNKREYADYFAKQTIEVHGQWMKQVGVEVILPVPMYPKKKRKRGYNQAESFGRALSIATGIPMDTKIVKRVKNTAPQKHLSDIERKNNLKNAFQMQGNVVEYKCAMVVDDIYTTGSTAEAVARELIKRGTHHVYHMTVCIGEEM